MLNLLALLMLGKLDMRWNMAFGWGQILAPRYFQSCEFFPVAALLVYCFRPEYLMCFFVV